MIVVFEGEVMQSKVGSAALEGHMCGASISMPKNCL